MQLLLFLLSITMITIAFYAKTTRRKRKWLKLRIHHAFATQRRVKFPKKMNESEKVACGIYMNLLLDPTTKLYYDIVTAECYVSDAEKTIFIFLETQNLKIINTVYGYDTPLQNETEQYLSDRFKRELTKRRKQFKDEAMKKVEHSLHNTLDKLKERQQKHDL